MPTETVLVTGGAGFIGAHTAKALAEAGYGVVVFDDLSSGYREAVRWGDLVTGDIRDEAALVAAMQTYGVSAVIHFAGLIEVGRSVTRPDLFYDVNVTGTQRLLNAMRRAGVGRIVFSSSAAVYGQSGAGAGPDTIAEDYVKAPVSPYGDTKLAAERLIAAYCTAFGLSGVALRYFNAAGCDPSGLIGEAHHPETHLIPLAIDAVIGRRPELTVFGLDYPTFDGTCLRDYIHVTDLAAAHIAALKLGLAPGDFEAFNVGAGQGHTVLQVIEAVGRAAGREVPHRVSARRAGDPPVLVADPARAINRLGWTPQHSTLPWIVESALRWRRSPAYGPGATTAP